VKWGVEFGFRGTTASDVAPLPNRLLTLTCKRLTSVSHTKDVVKDSRTVAAELIVLPPKRVLKAVLRYMRCILKRMMQVERREGKEIDAEAWRPRVEPRVKCCRRLMVLALISHTQSQIDAAYQGKCSYQRW